MTPSFRGVSARNFAEKLRGSSQSFFAKFLGEKNGLRELMRNLEEFSLRKFAFENFCSRSEREKELFSWADLYFVLRVYESVNYPRRFFRFIQAYNMPLSGQLNQTVSH